MLADPHQQLHAEITKSHPVDIEAFVGSLSPKINSIQGGINSLGLMKPTIDTPIAACNNVEANTR